MSTLTIRVPDATHARLKQLAKSKKVRAMSRSVLNGEGATAPGWHVTRPWRAKSLEWNARVSLTR